MEQSKTAYKHKYKTRKNAIYGFNCVLQLIKNTRKPYKRIQAEYRLRNIDNNNDDNDDTWQMTIQRRCCVLA